MSGAGGGGAGAAAPGEDSAEHWRRQARHYEQKALDIQQELDEYTENSAQLEKELEASLVQVEKQNRDLENQNQRLKNEIVNLKNKLDRSQHETNALENELQSLKMEKDKQATYVRELEQKNDDLERAQRVITESVAYVEALLNQAYERNAVLESEVDEVEALKVRLQRATDEARDLKQELKVVERLPGEKEKEDNDNAPAVNGHTTPLKRQDTNEATPLKRELNGNTMTPSSRVSAINIVGDLLRKVGLERFLCTDCGKVRCTCAVPLEAPTTDPHSDKEPVTSCVNYHRQSSTTDDIEYRRPRELSKQNSESNTATENHSLKKRMSEQPFARGTEAGNGKLRRSFVVRSREGLGNLFGLSARRDAHRPNLVQQNTSS